eukprot:gb/GECG01003541.1/.p1 GENE.gb/GECG01003541.1/~~gb/GECG01003541.1/.p1  ORF type:complete len:187 (+),score=22.36 gb/GECG01003541.1/:1-561(+)
MAASEESFDYPPMYDFPPFFTIQPSDETRMKQLEQWRKFILHWVQHNAAKEAMLVDVHSFPLFKNDRIHRSLSQEGVEQVVNHLVRSGNGEWDDPQGKTRFRVFIKRPEEWAGIIFDYVCRFDMFRNVYTVYELHSGDISIGAPFSNVDPILLLRALRYLQQQGRAEVYEGTTVDEHGVKFHNPET